MSDNQTTDYHVLPPCPVCGRERRRSYLSELHAAAQDVIHMAPEEDYVLVRRSAFEKLQELVQWPAP